MEAKTWKDRSEKLRIAPRKGEKNGDMKGAENSSSRFSPWQDLAD